jgi:type IV secretion system protein TrbE
MLSYTPPLRRQTRIIDLIYDDDDPSAAEIPPSERQVEYFQRTLGDIEDALTDLLNLRRMGGFTETDDAGTTHWRDELVNYLQFCLTGELAGLNIPPCPMYLDAIIGGQELWAGDTRQDDQGVGASRTPFCSSQWSGQLSPWTASSGRILARSSRDVKTGDGKGF